MRALLWIGVALAALLTGCSSSGKSSNPSPTTTASTTYQLSATLDTKQVVTPANKTWKPPASIADATGTFSGSIDTRTGVLDWQLEYTGVGKPTLPIADIHIGPRGRFGAVLVRLCGPCRPGQDSGTVTVKPPARSVQLTSGNTWVTLIVDKYPNGAIRGQIAPK
jgi:hypothetical protein